MNREEMIRRLDAGEDPLEVSIVKWEFLRDMRDEIEEYIEINSTTCALCWDCNTNCDEGCVIYNHTNKVACHSTPYSNYAMDTTKYNAGRMVMFLKSLREE